MTARESSIEGGGTESMMSCALANACWRNNLASGSVDGTEEKGVGQSACSAEWRAAIRWKENSMQVYHRRVFSTCYVRER